MGKKFRSFYALILAAVFMAACARDPKDAAALSKDNEKLYAANLEAEYTAMNIEEKKKYALKEQARARNEMIAAENLKIEQQKAAEAERIKKESDEQEKAQRAKEEQEMALAAGSQNINSNVSVAAERHVNDSKFSSSTSYLIWVNTSEQNVYVFQWTNNSWKLIRSMVCATGTDTTPTVTGVFSIRGRGDYFRVNEDIICKYFTVFYGNYYFHTVLLDNNGNVVDGTLGRKASHGCIRLAVENAYWINRFMPDGTAVIVN